MKYEHTHVSRLDTSPAMVVSQDEETITLVNEDGHTWTDPADQWLPLPRPSITLDLEIENHYYGDEPVTTFKTVEVTEPPADPDARSDWEYDEIFPHTGTGKTEGDSCYFVTVRSSSDPALIPAGTEYEFGT